MPTLRERLSDILLGPEKRRWQAASEALVSMTQRWPSIVREGMTQGERASISELDARLVDLMSRQLSFNTGQPQGWESTESDRRQAVDQSRRAYDNDPTAEAICDTWTSWGFGTEVDVAPRDPAAKLAWDEFWNDPQNAYLLNQKRVNDLSTYLLRDGDYVLLFYINTLTGRVVLRRAQSIEIQGGPLGTGIVTLPQDREVPVLYRRQLMATGTNIEHPVQYIRDWRATDAMIEEVRANSEWHFEDGIFLDEAKPETRVVGLHVAHKVRQLRGWPLMTTGLPWASAYQNFLRDRAAIAAAAARYFEKLKVKGGQRVVDSLVSAMQSSLTHNSNTYETNPVPAAGARWIENDQADLSRFSMATGSSDAETDGAMLKAHAALAGRMPSHWLGSGKDVQWATAQEMRLPILRALNGYGLFWSATWEEMAEIVLTAAEQYRPDMAGKKYTTYEVDVNSDTMNTVELDDVVGLMSELQGTAKDKVFGGTDFTLAYTSLARLALQTIGVKNTDDVLPIDRTGEPGAQTTPAPTGAEQPAAGLEPGEQTVVPARAEAQGGLGEALAEARPFGAEAYLRGLRRGVVGLWNSSLDATRFFDIFTNAIQVGLTDAFYAGAKEMGISPEDLDPLEKMALQEIISVEYGYVPAFGVDIEMGGKAAGGRLADFDARLAQWAMRWGSVHDQAMALVGRNAPLEWTLGDSADTSPDCLALQGKVKRASAWWRAGVTPRSSRLDCGLGCRCSLAKTDKPLTRGPLPALHGKWGEAELPNDDPLSFRPKDFTALVLANIPGAPTPPAGPSLAESDDEPEMTNKPAPKPGKPVNTKGETK